MSESTIVDFINTNFWVGCIGALAPEALRLYNLRTNAVFKWNPGYLLCTLPLVLTGGFIASLSEPTVVWSAFYSGLCAPVLITTAAKDAAKVEKELVTTKAEVQELELKTSQTQKQKEVLQAEIERLERNVARLENEKTEKTLEETGIPVPASAPIVVPTPAPVPQNSVSFPASKSLSPPPKSVNRRPVLFLITTLAIVLSISIFKLGAYPIGLLIQIIIIIVAIIYLIYLLKNNHLLKEYLKGL